MHIVHVVENLNQGGAERVVIDLLRQQSAAGHQCEVICLFEAGLLAPELTETGIPVHAINKRYGESLRPLQRLRTLLRLAAADVIHSHNAVAGYYVTFAGLALGLFHINTRHSMASGTPWQRKNLLFRLAALLIDRVCFVCESARQQALHWRLVPAARTRTLYNGLDIQPPPGEGRDALLSASGFAADALVLGTVGRVVPIKHQSLLVEALEKLAARWPGLRLVIIGAGDSLPALTERVAASPVAARIALLGQRHDARLLMAGFDLFALCSDSEGFSVALLEAGIAGCPVVATDVGGNAEILADGKHGLLVNAGDGNALAAAIDTILCDRDSAAGRARLLQHWVIERCSRERMASDYLALYQEARR